jgi:hypothetical protein
MRPIVPQRRLRAAFGVTSRMPDQSLADITGLDVARAAGLGHQQPDDTVLGQRTDRVHERIDQVTVVLAPPEDDDVGHLVGVLVDHLTARDVDDRVTQILVGVLVPAELLHDHARLDAQPGRHAGAVDAHPCCSSIGDCAD